MRARQIDIYFNDPTGIGYVFVIDVEGEDLVRLTIDKQPAVNNSRAWSAIRASPKRRH